MSVPNSVAFTQWSVRSTRSKRRKVVGGVRSTTTPEMRSGGIVVTSVGLADPSVDVVAARLPIALLHVLGEHDGVEPLQRLVAVHRRDVEAHRSAVLVGQR